MIVSRRRQHPAYHGTQNPAHQGTRRGIGVLAAVAGLALVAACGGGSGDAGATKSNAAGCEPFEAYQGHSGTTVTAYGSIRDVEEDSLNKAWETFSRCTGITVQYEGSGEFEAQLPIRVDGGNAPDLAFIPQPGLLATFAKAGKVKPAAADLKTAAQKDYSKDWLNYGTVNGTFYAAPLGAAVKSFVWYSPAFFKEHGYQVPATWNDMIALSDTIAATGVKPWCAGIESGDATGWPATDWIEDVLLRTAGPAVYDGWVSHQIPFNGPKVTEAFGRAATILKNERYVNGGFGGVKSISTTAFQEAGLPVLSKKCALHRQASFYAAQWPNGTRIGDTEDVSAFYLPPIAGAGKPVLGSGEFVAAFADRPEVQAVRRYLASADFANRRAKLGSWVSANRGLDLANVASPIDKRSAQLLQDPQTEFRFDGSDQMPAAVGAGTFWKGMVDWINGKDTKAVLDAIENSWPKK